MLAVLCALLLGCNGPAGVSPSKFYSDPDLIALCKAIKSGDTAEIDRLADAGIDLNAEGKETMRPLFFALLVENKKSFEHLLKKGAHTKVFNKAGYAPIHYAARNEHDSEWLEILLKHGADPNLIRKEFGYSTTPIYGAIHSRKKRNLDLLIQAGADINFQDESGGTPVVFSAGVGWFDTAYYLLEAGADYRIASKGGSDVAYEAMAAKMYPNGDLEQWRKKVIAFLEKEGVDLEPAREKAEAKWRKIGEEAKKRSGK